ncbi:hypothetical protein OQJ46_15375 [Microbulbifer thermotolerans]|uniref:hypothetical protein n=1 Tax=Microbulbifer thermotolerans TaxID=252514 RepID=UPI00224A96FA|nr:hypothetical protein [Microbulbifer thermotolerans]MCX2784375.1 hypothetical protein [Microbulbifer thermotolerans]MCX2843085.1 hypothetical protein [Microbulbifer thermotolerans]
MTGTFTSVIRGFGLLCVFWGFSYCLSAKAAEAEADYCSADASGNYFTPLAPVRAETSELCFTHSEEIKSVENLVLADVAVQPQFHDPALNVIHLSGRQLKTKVFLKNKPLLIVAEPYKRHSMAKLCKELIQGGFQSPKILIGGDIAGSDTVSIVSVEDFIVEVSNFGAVTVATSRQVAKELSVLGIASVAVEENLQLAPVVHKAALDYSINGYLPVFLVGRKSEEAKLKLQLESEPLSDVYLVSGGIEQIKSALKMSSLNAVKRQGLGGVSSCAG